MNNIDIHADDYGITANASRKILELVNCRKLTGISIMPNMSAFEEALLLWKNTLKTGCDPWISVHLNFMEGHCLSDFRQLSYLVDEKGMFRITWTSLVKYNYHPKVRNIVKRQLKQEIKAQLDRVMEAYHLREGKRLRVDSHQHTHMIPVVMEALLEVINENHYATEYIRLSKEPWWIYLGQPQLYHTYSIINMIKVAVLNWYAGKDERLLRKKGIPSMLLSGVFFSGKMDKKRLEILYPKLKKYAEKKKLFLEILFHPGDTLPEEITEEFKDSEAIKFYLSANRKEEYEAVNALSFHNHL